MNFWKLTILVLIVLMSGLVGSFKNVSFAQQTYECDSYCRNILQKKIRRKLPRKMYIKTDNFRNYQRKIRIRGLSGTAKSKTLSLSNNSVQLIWNGWGIGHTMMKLEEINSGKQFSISNSFNEISYTLGDKITLSIGTGLLGSGKGTYKESQKEFNSEKASGSSNFFIIGIELSGIEILYGLRKFSFENKEFQRTVSGNIEKVESNYKVSGNIHLLGIGVSF